jgi:hypothetical protein
MASRFIIEEVDPETAFTVWEHSPHGTVFTHPYVATRISHSVSWFAAIKGSEIFVVWPVALNQDGGVELPSFSYFFGPFWSEVAVGRSVTSRLVDRLDAYDGLIEAILQRFGSVRAELHPLLLDVRAFSWWNYHSPGKPRFEIEPRYTARIDGLQDSTTDELLSNLRELRRREVRKVERQESPLLKASVSVDELVALYQTTFERQGVNVPTGSLESIDGLCRLVDEGYGRITATVDSDSSCVASAVLCLDGHDTANMVLNLTDPSQRGTGIGPWTVFQSILQAKEAGLTHYDFNGANSPQRGDDKHSYGASEVLYFTVNHSEQL